MSDCPLSALYFRKSKTWPVGRARSEEEEMEVNLELIVRKRWN